MFYLDSSGMEPTLRFGDVIQGFPICFSVIDEPSHQSDFNITVSAPNYAVVLSPCCSIADKVLAIAPLKELDNRIFANPYLAEDPTRINDLVTAEKSVPPIRLEQMSPEEKTNLLASGDKYVFVDLFVYAECDLFAEYTIHRRDQKFITRCYVIDFRDSIKIHCASILSPKYEPDAGHKVLQLSVETRELMRRKISSFYRRAPAEDLAILAS